MAQINFFSGANKIKLKFCSKWADDVRKSNNLKLALKEQLDVLNKDAELQELVSVKEVGYDTLSDEIPNDHIHSKTA